MLETKLVSSLEKCFIDQTPADFSPVTRLRIYKNTVASVQLLAYNPDEYGPTNEGVFTFYTPQVDAPTGARVTLRTVESVPNITPIGATVATAKKADSGLLRTTPGLYPDVLYPLLKHGTVGVPYQALRSVWIDIGGDLSAGEHTVTVRMITKTGEVAAENTFTLQVIDVCLPEQDTIVEMWFHADCLANYYDCEVFSDKHWEICERFACAAAKNGINMLTVPVFTMPCDTEIGGERTTTQLVGVTRVGNAYTFDFTLVDRWMDMLKSNGIQYYGISHLFTQWGALHAPKVMATVDGEYKRLFGWETDAGGEEYVTFLRSFLKAFTAHLEAKGYHDEIYFHLSDEPNDQHLAQYTLNKNNIADILAGWKITDAISHVEYYRDGVCEIPVAVTEAIVPFLEEDIKERWTYYCCGPWRGYSNRFMSMHSARTRYLGTQLYRYNMKGFLHWGYNFYSSSGSVDTIVPYLINNTGDGVGGGDAFCVYPGPKGQPYESLRLKALGQGIEDIRVMQLCEKYYGKDTVVAEMEKIVGTILFNECVDDTATMTALRDRLDEMILDVIG